MHELAAQIKQRARQIGFDLVGIAPAEPSKFRDYLRQWLDDGQAGEMQWLQKRFDERVDPGVYLPGAKSVICVAINYQPPSTGTLGVGRANLGKTARYALGEDYHEVVKARLHQLADWIQQIVPDANTRAAVDTAPVMEKELAARAGIGWMGKNTCIINEQVGSWLLLGEIITTLDLPHDQPAIDRCGTCRRCIDACPTQAITAPYQLDARRCISYLTIELRNPIPAEFHEKLGGWLFGCDICQEVCPWNHEFESGTLDLAEVLNWEQSDYSSRLRGSAMKRVKLPVLKRNAAIVLENLNACRSGRACPPHET